MSDKILDNDIRAVQSLELFKNWLAKHPFIKYTGNDNIDDILLHILRVKKFSMQKTYESFELTIPFIVSHHDWFSNPSPADYEFTDKPNSPFIILKKRDSDGRMIFIYKMKNFDNFESVEFFRQTFLTPSLLMFEKDAQLNGVVLIVDFTDVNLGKLRKFSIQTIYDTFQMSKFGGIRLKHVNFIGVPQFLKPFFDIAKKFTTAKLAKRLNFMNDVKELSKHMDVSVLPEEYGGSSNELLDYKPFENGLVYSIKFNKFDVNFSKIQDYENVGTFRKLEID